MPCDTTLCALDRNTHAAVWSHPHPGAGLLALSRNGVLDVVDTGRITAINLQ